jgi:hypothetical protein
MFEAVVELPHPQIPSQWKALCISQKVMPKLITIFYEYIAWAATASGHAV